MSELLEAKADVSAKKMSKVDKVEKTYKPVKPIDEPKKDLINPEDFYDDKSPKKESKEKEKAPKLEKENYKIDKDLSVEEKLTMGWKKEATTAYIHGAEKKIMVLKKQVDGQENNAFVREYIDDGNMPKHLVGEQLFTRNAVLNLGLETKLPIYELVYEQVENIRGGLEKYKKFLKNNFQKDGENLFPGYRYQDKEGFYDVGTRTDCWVSGGGYVGIGNGGMVRYSQGRSCGFSLRLLKQE